MPSAHSAMATGLLAWYILELFFEDNKTTRIEMTQNSFVLALLLLPVPYSRVYLHYHTILQVIIGSIIGLSISLAWFLFLTRVVLPRGWLNTIVETQFGRKLGMENDYRLSETVGYNENYLIP